MSDTTTTTPAIDNLWSPQTLIGLLAMGIVAATIAGIFLVGDKPTIAQTVGGVMTIGGTVVGFYFGSSKGSQAKDERSAPAVVVTPPAAVVVQPPTEQPNARG